MKDDDKRKLAILEEKARKAFERGQKRLEKAQHKLASEALKEAVVHFTRAAELDPCNRTRSNLAAIQESLGEVQNEVGRFDEAIARHTTALGHREELYKAEPNASRRADVARSLNNLGAALYHAGRFAEAIDRYRAALGHREELYKAEPSASRRTDVAMALNNLGAALNEAGRFAEAIEMCTAALDHRQNLYRVEPSSTHRSELAGILNNLGISYDGAGRFAEAIDRYESSLGHRVNLYKADPNVTHRAELARVLNNLGIALGSAGRLTATIDRYTTALGHYEDLYRVEPNASRRADVAMVLRNLGVALHRSGRFAEASDRYKAVLGHREALYKVEPNAARRAGLANALSSLGDAFMSFGRFTEASESYKAALDHREDIYEAEPNASSHSNIARALAKLTFARVQNDEFSDLEFASQRAIAQVLSSEDRDSRSSVYHTLCLAFALASRSGAGEGYLELAIMLGKEAVNGLQEVRSLNRGMDTELQQSFLASNEEIYTHLIDLLIEVGRLGEAEVVMRMLKEDEYFDFVRRDAGLAAKEITTGYTQIEQAARKFQERALNQSAFELSEEAERLRRRSDGLSAAEKARLDEIERELETHYRDYKYWLNDLLQMLRTSRAQAAKEAVELNLGLLEVEKGNLEAMGRELGAPVVMLHLIVMKDKLRGIVTTASQQDAFEVGVKQAELNRLVTEFRNAVKDVGNAGRHLETARKLHDLLLKDVRRLLPPPVNGVPPIVLLSLTGTLRYLPFAALHDGNHYLIEDMALLIRTEAVKGNLRDGRREKWQAAGFGVEMPTSVRNPGMETRHYAPLLAVPEELNAVVRMPGESTGAIPGEKYLNGAFTRESLAGALGSQSTVVHIATHFNFNASEPMTSYLVLGDETALTLDQLVDRQYDFTKVDLVTLSACETAMGSGEFGQGREVEGLGGFIQQRGAKAVIATLWKVADKSTAKLMASFYRDCTSGMNKVMALRQAQLDLLHNTYNSPRAAGRSADNGTATMETANDDTEGPASAVGASTEATSAKVTIAATFATPSARGSYDGSSELHTPNTATGPSANPSPRAATPNPPIASTPPFYWAPFILMGNPR